MELHGDLHSSYLICTHPRSGASQSPGKLAEIAVSREKSDILARVKKKCVQCGKQIPSVALNCVFCSGRQPAPDFSDVDVLRDAVDRARSKSESHAVIAASGGMYEDDDPSS